MSLDLKLMGGKLYRCREHLQMSLSEVANKTGISTTRLEEFESGRAEPTGDEILILADFYKRDYSFFISNQKQSAIEQVDILYRKFGDGFSKADRLVIQEFIYLCESEQYVLETLNFKITPFEYPINGPGVYKSQGKLAADKFRGLFANDNLNVNLYDELRKFGFHIFRRKLVNSDISGLFIWHPWAGKCILVNYDEDIFRQNFTLAHETAHAILDAQQVNISSNKDSKTDFVEVRANTFASNFLMPRKLLSALGSVEWNPKNVIHYATKFRVTTQPFLIAIKEAGLIDDIQYKQLSSTRIPRELKVDSELVGLTEKIADAKRTLLEKGLSTFYVRKCYDAYVAGEISANKLAEMLLTDEIQLPVILDLFKLKLAHDN